MDIEKDISDIYAKLVDAQKRNELKEIDDDLLHDHRLAKLGATQILAELTVARAVAVEIFGNDLRPADVWNAYDAINKAKLQAVFTASGKQQMAEGKGPLTLESIMGGPLSGSGKGGTGFN